MHFLPANCSLPFWQENISHENYTAANMTVGKYYYTLQYTTFFGVVKRKLFRPSNALVSPVLAPCRDPVA